MDITLDKEPTILIIQRRKGQITAPAESVCQVSDDQPAINEAIVKIVTIPSPPPPMVMASTVVSSDIIDEFISENPSPPIVRPPLDVQLPPRIKFADVLSNDALFVDFIFDVYQRFCETLGECITRKSQ